MNNISPEEIAKNLFSLDPTLPNSIQLLLYEINTDTIDTTYIFEVLITILMEGLDITLGGLESADLKLFTTDHILSLNNWFKSIGFIINVDTFYKEIDKKNYNNYYCKIMVKTKLFETFFILKKISKKYHFLLNNNIFNDTDEIDEIDEINELKDIYAVFINIDNIVYKISFDYYLYKDILSCKNEFIKN